MIDDIILKYIFVSGKNCKMVKLLITKFPINVKYSSIIAEYYRRL